MLFPVVTAFVCGVVLTVAAQWVRNMFFNSPLPPMLPAFPPTIGGYERLNREWHTYHITRDSVNHSPEPFWQHGKTALNVRTRFTGGLTRRYITEGIRMLKTHQYKTRGEIRGGRFFEIRSNPNIPSTFSLALFTDLNHDEILLGEWLGLDWDSQVFTGPVIYAARQLTLDELNQAAGTDLSYLDS